MSSAAWHVINWKDYIDGPFDSFESALTEAMYLAQENRVRPHVKRLSQDFYQYRGPYDKQEKWWPTFWICTLEAAVRRGIPESRFNPSFEEAA